MVAVLQQRHECRRDRSHARGESQRGIDTFQCRNRFFRTVLVGLPYRVLKVVAAGSP